VRGLRSVPVSRTVLLAAPTGRVGRAHRSDLAERARGFVYGRGVARRDGGDATHSIVAMVMAKRLKAITDKPCAHSASAFRTLYQAR